MCTLVSILQFLTFIAFYAVTRSQPPIQEQYVVL